MAPLHIVITLPLLSLLTHPSLSQPTSCNSKASFFSHKTNTFDNCNDLPTLQAVLHWTYDPTKSTLSMAYTSTPPTPDGWVSWALNPRGSGMVGAQSLIAFKPNEGGPINVNTYDITSYHGITMGPISYNVTGLSAEESSEGQFTIFATWALPKRDGGPTTVNQVWQVGLVVGGRPSKHDFEQPNLISRMKLSLASSGPSVGLVEAPSGSSKPGASAPKLRSNGAEGCLPCVNGVGLALLLALGSFVVSLL